MGKKSRFRKSRGEAEIKKLTEAEMLDIQADEFAHMSKYLERYEGVFWVSLLSTDESYADLFRKFNRLYVQAAHAYNEKHGRHNRMVQANPKHFAEMYAPVESNENSFPLMMKTTWRSTLL